MLRCLTIRCLVARHTDDGDARYSSVRQLSHASSEHDTLGRTPSTRLLPELDRITAAGQEPTATMAVATIGPMPDVIAL